VLIALITTGVNVTSLARIKDLMLSLAEKKTALITLTSIIILFFGLKLI
jgi:hypothetical protein